MTNTVADLDVTAAALPEIEVLYRTMQSLAVLDLVKATDWRMRTWLFDATKSYGPMGEWRDGSGGTFTVHFIGGGAFIRVFDHESSLTPYAWDPHQPVPGLLEPVPAVFTPALTDETLTYGDPCPVTATFWRMPEHTRWAHGHATDPGVLDADGDPFDDAANNGTEYLDELVYTAQDYHAQQVEWGYTPALHAVEHVFAHRPLTPQIVAALRTPSAQPDTRTVADLTTPLRKIGYPLPDALAGPHDWTVYGHYLQGDAIHVEASPQVAARFLTEHLGMNLTAPDRFGNGLEWKQVTGPNTDGSFPTQPPLLETILGERSWEPGPRTRVYSTDQVTAALA